MSDRVIPNKTFTSYPMFWDFVASFYDVATDVVNKKCNQQVSSLVASYIGTTDNVLECACGTGLLTKQIYPLCRSIIATDFSSSMLQQTKKKCEKATNLSIEKVDITVLPYPDDTFDTVVAGNVLHLLPDPMKAVKELCRVCKQGGKVILPTYVTHEKKGGATMWLAFLKMIGISFKKQFSYPSYKQFIESAGYANSEFILIKGTPSCAVAVVKKLLL